MGEVEEEFRLYLLALLYLGNTEETMDLDGFRLKPERRTGWCERPREVDPRGGSAASDIAVIGRPMNRDTPHATTVIGT